MTANQRRPGFRLPWSSESGEPGAEAEPAAPDTEAPAEPSSDEVDLAAGAEPAAAEAATDEGMEGPMNETTTADAEPQAEVEAPADDEVTTAAEEAPAPEAAAEPAAPAAAAPAENGDDFMRDLVSAMRRVAEEAREAGVRDLRARAEEKVRLLEADAERRRDELRARAEADVAGVGEWAKAEAERIKREAEQRVVARQAQLEQQLAADTTRTETETKVLRDRVAEYERELDGYHAQLAEINDPAAFAAAAKRMPKPPALGTSGGVSGVATGWAKPADSAQTPVEPSTAASNGVPAAANQVHPAEEEVLAARLAQLDASLASAEAAAPASTEPATTEVVVKGLGSFGAITGFRQALSGVEGIDGVALSLGQTGEFVFRATHAAGFDVRGAIVSLEGEGAKVEDRPEGGLRVTLDRAR